jgi:hypothetical protein
LVVHGNRVLVTSNNGFIDEPAPDPSVVGYQGTVMCLDRATVEFQWQSAHARCVADAQAALAEACR